MRLPGWCLAAGLVVCLGAGRAGAAAPNGVSEPVHLSIQPDPAANTVYAPPQQPRDDEGVNQGGVHLDLTVRYVTDYVFRGLDQGEAIARTPEDNSTDPTIDEDVGTEDTPSWQFDGRISFDLGKLPHPYLGIFVNLYDSDPVSTFQEVRPFFGAEWTIKPFVLEGGYQTFIYPEREDSDTAEVYGRITLDDRRLFKTEKPLLSPYVYGAYDFDLYNGWYLEAGISHTFEIQDTGVTITAVADVAYVIGQQLFLRSGEDATGFQHYDIGLIGRYSLNKLFKMSDRYGQFDIEGYLFYTDGIDDALLSDTQLWGGLGIRLRY